MFAAGWNRKKFSPGRCGGNKAIFSFGLSAQTSDLVGTFGCTPRERERITILFDNPFCSPNHSEKYIKVEFYEEDWNTQTWMIFRIFKYAHSLNKELWMLMTSNFKRLIWRMRVCVTSTNFHTSTQTYPANDEIVSLVRAASSKMMIIPLLLCSSGE